MLSIILWKNKVISSEKKHVYFVKLILYFILPDSIWATGVFSSWMSGSKGHTPCQKEQGQGGSLSQIQNLSTTKLK